jgi:myo-inositol-1(or 4)-monophosphatase
VSAQGTARYSGRADRRELLDLAVSIALEAGEVLRRHLSAARPTQMVTDSVRTKSSHTDLVTAADHASEATILSRLRAARPDDAVLAEESGRQDGTSGYMWIVDPLDGTINFVYGFPVFAVSIAVMGPAGDERSGNGGPTIKTLAGVVHDPLRGETFSAIADSGAWRDGEALVIGPAPSIGDSLIATGFSYDSGRRRSQADLLTHVLPVVRDIRRAGAAAIDLCWVAAGRLDGMFEAGLAPWDVAAGSLIVTEAGGTVEEVPGLLGSDGGPTLVATAPGLHAALRALLESAGTSTPPAPER